MTLPQRRPGRVRGAVARAGRVLPRPGGGARPDPDGVRQAAGGEPGGVVPAGRVQGRDRGDALDDLPPGLGDRPGDGPARRWRWTPRSRSSTAPSGPTPSPTAACRSSAGWGCCARARSSGCCGTCGCCGSSRAPPRCRSSSSPGPSGSGRPSTGGDVHALAWRPPARVSTCKEEGDPRRVTVRGQQHHRRPGGFGPNEWLVDELYQQYLEGPEQRRQGVVGLLRGLPAADGPGRPPRAAATNGGPGAGRDAPRPRSGRRAHPRRRAADAARRRRARRRAGGPEAGRRPGQPAGAPPPASDAAPAAEASRQARPSSGGDVVTAQGPGRPRRHQHGGQPRGPDRDQRPGGPGQAAHRQPHRHQQPPAARPRRQGLVHPPDRLRGGQGARRRCRR